MKQFHFSIGLHALATIALLLVLFALPILVQAQESTSEAEPVATEIPQPVIVVESPAEEGTSSDSSPALPESFSTIAFAAPLVTLIVAFLKRYLKTVPAALLNFYISLAVFVLYTVLSQNGLASQFEAFTGSITDILNAVSNLLTGVGGTALLSAGIYTASQKYQVPYVGKARVTEAQAAKMTKPSASE